MAKIKQTGRGITIKIIYIQNNVYKIINPGKRERLQEVLVKNKNKIKNKSQGN